MPKTGTIIQTASEKYVEQTSLRALIQVIPYVGGSLDTLLSGEGTKIQKQRMESFLRELELRMSSVESTHQIQPTAELFDLMMNSFDGVLRTRSEKKRRRFASLIANQVSMTRDWEDADAALRLIGTLTDLHIEILIVAKNAQKCTISELHGLQVVALFEPYHEAMKDGNYGHQSFRYKAEKDLGYGCGTVKTDDIEPTDLLSSLPQYSFNTIRMACSELVGYSLLYDIGLGKKSMPLTYLEKTTLVDWLFSWISE